MPEHDGHDGQSPPNSLSPVAVPTGCTSTLQRSCATTTTSVWRLREVPDRPGEWRHAGSDTSGPLTEVLRAVAAAYLDRGESALMGPQRFVHRGVVEAMLFTQESCAALHAWLGFEHSASECGSEVIEGIGRRDYTAHWGHWVVLEHGEFRVVRDDDFAAEYTPAGGPDREQVYERIAAVYHGDLTTDEATDAVMMLIEGPPLCQALGCPIQALTTFGDGEGRALDLCEDHGDLLAVGFALKRPRSTAAPIGAQPQGGADWVTDDRGRLDDGHGDPLDTGGVGAEEQKLVDLIAALDVSLHEAKAARDRYVADRLTEEGPADA